MIDKQDGRANGLNNKGYPLRKIVEQSEGSELHILECGHILPRKHNQYVRSRRCPECKGESLPESSYRKERDDLSAEMERCHRLLDAYYGESFETTSLDTLEDRLTTLFAELPKR